MIIFHITLKKKNPHTTYAKILVSYPIIPWGHTCQPPRVCKKNMSEIVGVVPFQ